jgi:hypothetical protein
MRLDDPPKFQNDLLFFQNISNINASIEKIIDPRLAQTKEISPPIAQYPAFSRNSPMRNLKQRYKPCSYQTTPAYLKKPITATFSEKMPLQRSKLSQISSQYIDYLKQGRNSPKHPLKVQKSTHSVVNHSTENLLSDLAVDDTLTMLRKHHDSSHTVITPR